MNKGKEGKKKKWDTDEVANQSDKTASEQKK